MNTYAIKTDTYEGPFELLAAAIKEGRIDIYEVSLSKITLEYLNYLNTVEILNLNAASEFLLMAAYLIEMKSRKLLPHSPIFEEQIEEEEIEMDLASHIAEYNLYKHLAHKLKGYKDSFSRIYSRYHFNERSDASQNIILKDVNLLDLCAAFQRVWEQAQADEEIRAITEEPITLAEKIEEVKVILAHSKGRVYFEKLFIRRTRLEIVITFLAVLELTRQKLIYLIQGEKFGEIYIGLSEDQADN